MFWLVISSGRPGAGETSIQHDARRHETPRTRRGDWEQPYPARLVTLGSLFIPGQPQLCLPWGCQGWVRNQVMISAGLAAGEDVGFGQRAAQNSVGSPRTHGDVNLIQSWRVAAIFGRFGKRSNPEPQVAQPLGRSSRLQYSQKVLPLCCTHLGSPSLPQFPSHPK